MRYSNFIEAYAHLGRQLRFLALAVSDDETRYYMNFFLIEPSEAPDTRTPKPPRQLADGTTPAPAPLPPLFRGVATDGRRVHLIDPLDESAADIGLELGFWHVVKNRPECVQLARCAEAPGTFYNYRKVMPQGAPVFETEFEGIRLKSKHNLARAGVRLSALYRAFPEASPLNLRYLADIGEPEDLFGPLPSPKWAVEWRRDRSAITFRAGPALAVIMPMQAD